MSSSDEDHAIFSSDPGKWMDMINKEVCVTLDDGTSQTGRVYTIDPVSQTVVLAKFVDDDTMRLVLVMGHMVQSVVVLDEDTEKYKDELDKLFKPKEVVNSSVEELEQKRDRLKSWLLKNHIPVQVG